MDGETLLEEPEMADLVFLDVEMPEKAELRSESVSKRRIRMR